MRRDSITFQFVEFIPKKLEDGVVYVTVSYATAVHKCCCGCGNKIVTPISPIDWTLTFDRDTISLDPSIGNWTLPCKSHYWIRRNRVEWAPQWTGKEIEAGRAQSLRAKAAYFKSETDTEEGRAGAGTTGLWHGIRRWWSRR